ncbi:exported protein of unknown function [Thermococcus nautili]|nr:exported protein of unknown function [Thermococcus nautili]
MSAFFPRSVTFLTAATLPLASSWKVTLTPRFSSAYFANSSSSCLNGTLSEPAWKIISVSSLRELPELPESLEPPMHPEATRDRTNRAIKARPVLRIETTK